MLRVALFSHGACSILDRIKVVTAMFGFRLDYSYGAAPIS
jgi:hypothetical protein